MTNPDSVNHNLVLIGGKTGAGKSAGLRNLTDPGGVLYANCESGKELPFPAKFRQTTITNPYTIWKLFEKAEKSESIHTIVLDTITFMMDMLESQIVLTADEKGKFKAWAAYGDFWRKLLHEYVGASSKNVIMLGHTADVHNEGESIMETLVKIKGSVMNQGVEAYFCNVLSAKKMAIPKLEPYQNDTLIITPEEEALGFKYVFQTKLTKDTVNERIRGPIGLWDTSETFIDNDAQFVLDRLHKYYNG